MKILRKASGLPPIDAVVFAGVGEPLFNYAGVTAAVGRIIGAAADFAEKTGTKARVHYMLLKGVNDSEEDIARLCALLEGNR